MDRIADRGVIWCCDHLIGAARDDGFGCFAVNIGERFCESFRVSTWRAAQAGDLRRQINVATTNRTRGFAFNIELQISAFAMRPVDEAALAVNAQADVVLAARCGLRDRVLTARATVKTQIREDRVDDRASLHQRTNVGAHRRDLEP